VAVPAAQVHRAAGALASNPGFASRLTGNGGIATAAEPVVSSAPTTVAVVATTAVGRTAGPFQEAKQFCKETFLKHGCQCRAMPSTLG
jgi:hypothetical protein